MFIILGTDGKEYGPVPTGQVLGWIGEGRANLQTRARRANETGWKTLGDFVEFNAAATRSPAVVTPEAPPLPVPTPVPAPVPTHLPVSPRPGLVVAGRGRRLGAALIEGFLQSLCKLPIALVFVQMFEEIARDPQGARPEQFSAALMEAYMQALPFLGLYVVVQITLLCARSQSIGKLLLGMRIIDVQTGEPAGPLRAFVLRGLLIALIEFIPLLGLLFWIVDSCFIFREDRRCLHDLIAGTSVVRT